ncbi:MAG: D-alanyl-D-alanine dipeptidase/CubicO group peptidase (beta-lactamase class C family) [Planctomycetota bacterium]|jgi:D-alanyl-D-alanine dipeptidase/CubicO group peptidase (beta-lactamase class C family)
MRRILLTLAFASCVAPPRFEAERFEPIVSDLSQFALRHQGEMGVPGIWIALLEVDPVTREEHLWAAALGGAVNSAYGATSSVAMPNDLDVLATHRVASISKLFTDTAAMVLVERGVLDLDEPIQTYLPTFAPENPFGKPVTLRNLMGHRAGIVRESPVGHYFDAAEPSLSATVASLNDTALVAEPGSTFKYSNPGIGVVGEVIAQVTGKPFEDAVRELVLKPLDLQDSDFAARPDLVARQTDGIMWTYDGRKIPTPNWRFGYTPAAELRSTVVDLVKFARSWFPGVKQRVLDVEAQRSMWQVPGGKSRGCGLGFFVGRHEGHLRVAHGGAVYGFASSLVALPELGLAVAVVCNKDFANDVSGAIADRALAAALANRRGETLPAAAFPQPLGVEAARALQGRWQIGDNWVELRERDGDLYYDPNIGVRTRMRRAADGTLIADDPLGIGPSRTLKPLPNGNFLDFDGEYVRQDDVPLPMPEELGDLLGEYGWDHNVLVVYEDHQRLGVLIEWVVRDLPTREGKDKYRFPPGMYTADQLLFERDDEGKVVTAVVGGARFPRRPGPSGGTFRIPVVHPVPELVAAAKTASPPAQPDGLRAFDLVDLAELDATIKLEIRYATDNNFLGAKVYDQAKAKMQRPAAMALLRAHRELAKHGLGLKIFDAYRPWSVTKVFWDATPSHLKHFVANPANGSRHNRGCAVDLTLYDLATGDEHAMPSGYDEFTARAYPDYPGGTSQQRYYREVLRRAMEAQGFAVYEHEWWHYDFAEWRAYPVGNVPF